MSERFGLSQTAIDSINSVLSNYGSIDVVLIYGSRAMGTYHKGSDIDLTIKSKKLTLSDLLKIENQIDDLLLPYKVDLSLYGAIDNPNFIEHIDRVGLVFE